MVRGGKHTQEHDRIDVAADPDSPEPEIRSGSKGALRSDFDLACKVPNKMIKTQKVLVPRQKWVVPLTGMVQPEICS